MKEGKPSRTALGAARHRAAHQVIEHGLVFCDPLAVRILGADADEAVQEAKKDPTRRRMRLFIAARSRFAEDALAVAVKQGATQVVVLGAGLDTFAYRSSLGGAVRVFEVDHPATQEWKRRLLAEAGIPQPASLTFAPIDFEKGTLADGLAAAGFDRDKQTFFTWLGVAPYLTEQAVFSTLEFVAGLPAKAHIVFDYGNPPRPDMGHEGYAAAHRELAARVAKIGESIRSHFETEKLHLRLRGMGFFEIEDLDPGLIRRRFLQGEKAQGPERGGHFLRASTLGPGGLP